MSNFKEIYKRENIKIKSFLMSLTNLYPKWCAQFISICSVNFGVQIKSATHMEYRLSLCREWRIPQNPPLTTSSASGNYTNILYKYSILRFLRINFEEVIIILGNMIQCSNHPALIVRSDVDWFQCLYSSFV